MSVLIGHDCPYNCDDPAYCPLVHDECWECQAIRDGATLMTWRTVALGVILGLAGWALVVALILTLT